MKKQWKEFWTTFRFLRRIGKTRDIVLYAAANKCEQFLKQIP